MPWWQFALLGGGGGAIVEFLAGFRCIARGRTGDGPMTDLKSQPPKLSRYLDIQAHLIMLPLRAALGSVAAVLFGLTGQVTGPYGVVAFGCAAPVLLAQLGSIEQVENLVKGVPRGQERQTEASDPPRAALPVEESQLG